MINRLRRFFKELFSVTWMTALVLIAAFVIVYIFYVAFMGLVVLAAMTVIIGASMGYNKAKQKPNPKTSRREPFVDMPFEEVKP